jgi:hypothetical protein
MGYALGAVERAMKVRDVILQALTGKLTWIQAADIRGRSVRSIRRLRLKFERYGVCVLVVSAPSTIGACGRRPRPPRPRPFRRDFQRRGPRADLARGGAAWCGRPDRGAACLSTSRTRNTTSSRPRLGASLLR